MTDDAKLLRLLSDLIVATPLMMDSQRHRQFDDARLALLAYIAANYVRRDANTRILAASELSCYGRATVSSSTACRFAVLRVIPDPLRGERVNVGMVLFALDGSHAACWLTKDWSRVEAICGGDSSLYQEIARQDFYDPINAGTMPLAEFDRLRGNWGPYTTVGLSEGGSSILDSYADVMDAMYGMFVAWPPVDPPWRKAVEGDDAKN